MEEPPGGSWTLPTGPTSHEGSLAAWELVVPSEIRAQTRPILGCPQSEDFSPAGGLRTAPVATGAGCLCYRKEGRAKGAGDAATRGRPLPGPRGALCIQLELGSVPSQRRQRPQNKDSAADTAVWPHRSGLTPSFLSINITKGGPEAFVLSSPSLKFMANLGPVIGKAVRVRGPGPCKSGPRASGCFLLSVQNKTTLRPAS